MFKNAYYQKDNQTIYIHLDGVLRQVPNRETFKNLFGVDFNSADVVNFDNASSAPYSVGYPILDGSRVYTLPNDATAYFADVFPWRQGVTVFRKIINKTQLDKLGFSKTFTPWTDRSTPSIEIPLAVDSGLNWHLQTFFDGYHIVYHYLCHPNNPINPFFATWLDNNFTKPEVKSRIIQTQTQIDQVKGMVSVVTPVLVPNGGDTHYTNQPVTITCSTPKAVIYYTLDGSDPVPGISPTYQGVINLSFISPNALSVVVRAIAEGYDSIGTSSVVSANFTFSNYLVSDPTFLPPAGNLQTDNVTVSLNCSTPNTRIYYTIDGTTPTSNSTLYSGSVQLDLSVASKTIRAVAIDNNYNSSSGVVAAEYRYVPVKLNAPLIFPLNSNQVTPSIIVNLEPTDPGSVIRYTLRNGINPDQSYAIPFRLLLAHTPTGSASVYAQATGTQGQVASDIVTKEYNCTVSWKHVWLLSTDSDDLVGNVRLQNTGVRFHTGTYGNSAQFEGSAILSTTSTSTMQSAVCSISAWAKIDSINNPENYVPVWGFEEISTGHDGPGVLVYSDGSVQGETIQSNGEYVLVKTDPDTVTLGNWFHYCLVIESNLINLYINGVFKKRAVYDGTISTSHFGRLNVGAEMHGTSSGGGIRHAMTGLVNRVYYTTEPLTANQVQLLFEVERDSRN